MHKESKAQSRKKQLYLSLSTDAASGTALGMLALILCYPDLWSQLFPEHLSLS